LKDGEVIKLVQVISGGSRVTQLQNRY